MEQTYEKQASVKNGVSRMVFAVLAILLEVLVILGLLFFAGQKAGWIYTLIHIVGTILVLRIYGSHKTASIRMTWMLVILLLPIFGTALYLLIGLNGHSLKMRKRYEDIDKILLPMLPANEKVSERAAKKDGRLGTVSEYIRRQAGYPIYQNTEITYYDDAEKGFEAQKTELAKAEKFIFMEYHAIEDAECWHEMRDILAERAKAGVEVRVFYDDMGSLGFINTDFIKRTESYGIRCRVFNPFAPGLNLFLNNRDHRKITVIDGKVGFTGGYNLANEYFHRTEPYGFWKDTGVKLVGDAVRSLTVTFLEMWNAVSENDRDDGDFRKYLAATGAEMVLEKGHTKVSVEKAERIAKDREEMFDKTKEQVMPDEKFLEEVKPIHGRHLGFVQPYADSPMDDLHIGEDVYISIAECAQKYAWFITPYLIITDEMNHAFSLAARRGVDVRIITPGIPDKKLVYSLTRSYYNGLVRNGVRIFEFTPGFCHAKMSITDDLMATCGTINLDYRSLYHHFENGCLYADCKAVMDTKKDFEETFAQCEEVTERYKSGRGAFLRLGQLLLRLAAPLM
ncbi:MAG: phospholipase D-like domain-containing protein [Eubacteriales bacterium]|nr:phospholipase D-like domain-containing protein [Eubacteriales bacterium]